MRIRALGLLGAGMFGLFACNLVASRELATAFNQADCQEFVPKR